MLKRFNNELSNELNYNEKVIWTDVPLRSIRAQKYDLILIPFSIIFFIISIIVFYKHLEKDSVYQIIFGAIYPIIGFYLLIGRFIVDCLIRSNTVYYLTNSRVIIIQKIVKTKISSIDLKSSLYIKMTVKRDGVGSIFFSDQEEPNTSTFNWIILQYDSIDYVRDVENVYNKIQDIKSNVE